MPLDFHHFRHFSPSRASHQNPLKVEEEPCLGSQCLWSLPLRGWLVDGWLVGLCGAMRWIHHESCFLPWFFSVESWQPKCLKPQGNTVIFQFWRKGRYPPSHQKTHGKTMDGEGQQGRLHQKGRDTWKQTPRSLRILRPRDPPLRRSKNLKCKLFGEQI